MTDVKADSPDEPQAAKEREQDPDRLTIVQADAFTWEAYSKVESEGH